MRWMYGTALSAVAAGVLADLWFAPDYELWAKVAVICVATLTTVFAALYGFRSKWWRNPIGKTYLVKSVLMALMLDQIALTLLVSADYPGRQHIRFVIYTSAAIAYVPMLITLWREQRRDRAVRRAAEDVRNP